MRPSWSWSCLFLAAAALLLLLLFSSMPGDVLAAPKPPVEYCYSSACNRTAAHLVKAIDPTADPCCDFYAFACGRFVRDTPLPEHESQVSVISQMQDRLQRQLRDVLEEPVDKDAVRPFRAARALYQSCVNTDRLEALGLEPARKAIRALGGWPVLDGDAWSAREKDFDWRAMLFKLEEAGLGGDFLFSLDVIPVINENRTFYSIMIDMPNLVLDLTGYKNASAAAARFDEYVNLTSNVAASLLGPAHHAAHAAHVNLTRVRDEMARMAALERELSSHMPSLELRYDRTRGVQPLPLSALASAAPWFPWTAFVRRALPPGTRLSEAERVSLRPQYLLGLRDVLAGAENKTLANYLVWRALHKHVLPRLNAATRALLTEFATGRAAGRERWKHCVGEVQDKVKIATSALYVRRYASPAVLRSARALVEDVSREMSRLLDDADWLHGKAKSSAKLKADSLEYIIGYKDSLLNDTFLDLQFPKIDLTVDSYLDNLLKLWKSQRREQFKKFHTEFKSADYTSVYGMVDEVNAYYVPNILGLPLGILQEPVFDSDRPQYMNYGSIGFVTGHESSHGFDEHGRMVNANGTLEMWWDDETMVSFYEKVACIVEQYGNVTDSVTNMTLNGHISRGENIADNAGVKLARRAYGRHAAQRDVPEPRIPLRFAEDGHVRLLDLAPQQMFWVAFAHFQCAKLSPRMLRDTLRTASHVPSEHRVNSVVRNQDAFAEDFHCPVGALMNPARKCHVW